MYHPTLGVRVRKKKKIRIAPEFPRVGSAASKGNLMS